jgi:hypothetical protein
MDTKIIELANISFEINNPNSKSDISHLQYKRTQLIQLLSEIFRRSNEIIQSKIEVKENTTYRTDVNHNANLFFHPWLFENTQQPITKNPYIGIFHPSGSIYAHNTSKFLNKLEKTIQYYHDNSFSPSNTSCIYIDHINIGIAIVVCVDDTSSKGRIELLISLTKSELIMLDFFNINNLKCFEIMEQLNNIGIFKPLLNKPEFKLLFSSENNKIVYETSSNNRANNRKYGLFMCDYKNGGNSTEVYNSILNVIFPIEKKNIPYIVEIESKLPSNLQSINWEFAIQIIAPYFS